MTKETDLVLLMCRRSNERTMDKIEVVLEILLDSGDSVKEIK